METGKEKDIVDKQAKKPLKELESPKTVYLKKKLKVTLRRSVKALDISKYPHIIASEKDDDKQNDVADQPTRYQHSAVRFADHIPEHSAGHSTVHLKKPLQISLQKKDNSGDSSKDTHALENTEATRVPEKVSSKGKKLRATLKKTRKDFLGEGGDTVEISETAAKRVTPPVGDAKDQKQKKTDDSHENLQVTLKKTKKDFLGESGDTVELANTKTKISIHKEKRKSVIQGQANELRETRKIQTYGLTKEDLKDTLKKKRGDFLHEGGDTVEVSRTSVTSNSNTSSNKPSPPQKGKQILTHTSRSIPKIIDPKQARDHASSKRQSQIQLDTNAKGSIQKKGSDTVVLKVIKDKKKKLAGILSASQTIRLGPQNIKGVVDERAETVVGEIGNASPTGEKGIQKEGLKKQTLKIKASIPSEKKPSGPPKTVKRPALKIVSISPASESTPPPKEGSDLVPKLLSKDGATQKRPPKATLKIKLPAQQDAGTPSKGNRRLKATLKIKAPPPASGKGQVPQMSYVSGSSLGQTTSGKTLKLKAIPSSTGKPFSISPKDAESTEKQQSLSIKKQGIELDNDWVTVAFSAASLTLIGSITYLMISQFFALFG